MALGDRAGTVFPKEFHMTRVHCVQVRHFLHLAPTGAATSAALPPHPEHNYYNSLWPTCGPGELLARLASQFCWQRLLANLGRQAWPEKPVGLAGKPGYI